MAVKQLLISSAWLSAFVDAGSMPVVLSQNFDTMVHATLPGYLAARAKFDTLPARDQIISDFLKMFTEFGVSDTVGLHMNHKHFNIPDGHVLCEEQFVNKSILKPMSIDNISAMVPANFALRDGKWTPYEFVINQPKAKQRLEKLERNEGFILKMTEMVDSLGLSDLLGFKIINRDNFQARTSMESRGEKWDELVVVPKMPVEDNDPSKKVFWMASGKCGECEDSCRSQDCDHGSCSETHTQDCDHDDD